MFCSGCGQQLPEGTEFCPDCGQSTASAPSVATSAPSAPASAAQPASSAPPQPAKKSRKKLIFGSLAGLFILGLFLGKEEEKISHAPSTGGGWPEAATKPVTPKGYELNAKDR